MKKNKPKSSHLRISKYLALVFSMSFTAVQAQSQIIHEAETTRMQAMFGEQWAADDKEVAKKLAALEKKFGKKPNIVYILADDIGYTELGSYGGGKIRGAPTQSLDQMAAEGMRFLSFYSEVENVWGKGNHFWGAHPDFRDTPAQTNTAAQMVEHDYNVGRILQTLTEMGIAENTLVIWSSDNGPHYAFHPHGGYSLLPGGKGETLEGGVRVPSIAWWPGMIGAGQDPLDIVSISDWFTTMVKVAGAMDQIPRDRVIDGVDQTGLLLLGEGKSRRDHLFYYAKGKLEAVRKDQVKMYMKPKNPDLKFVEVINLYHDPGERFGNEVQNGLWAGAGLGKLIQEHLKQIEEYPVRKLQAYWPDFDRSFDPEATPVYKPQKQVEW